MAVNDDFKIAYTIKEACDATGIGRSTLYTLIKDRRVEVVKLGTRTLIPKRSLERLFEETPRAA